MMFKKGSSRAKLAVVEAMLRDDPSVKPAAVVEEIHLCYESARRYVNEARQRGADRRRGERRAPSSSAASPPPLYATPIFKNL